jgi:Fe-S-cluster containining protein
MQIYLTGEDIKRISNVIGSSGFFRYEKPWSWCERDEADPVWEKHVFGCSRRRVVRRRVDGSCHFLGENGCVLDLEIRPLVCRLYPYEYRPDGIHGVHPKCPVSRSETPETDFKTMGMRSDRVNAWHAAFYAELARGKRTAARKKDS